MVADLGKEGRGGGSLRSKSYINAMNRDKKGRRSIFASLKGIFCGDEKEIMKNLRFESGRGDGGGVLRLDLSVEGGGGRKRGEGGEGRNEDKTVVILVGSAENRQLLGVKHVKLRNNGKADMKVNMELGGGGGGGEVIVRVMFEWMRGFDFQVVVDSSSSVGKKLSSDTKAFAPKT